MFSISIKHQVSMWSGEFHGILKSSSTAGREFSFNNWLRSQEIPPEMLAFALDSFLIYVVCILE